VHRDMRQQPLAYVRRYHDVIAIACINFVADILADGKRKTYRLAVGSIMVDGKTIERIVCEDGLTQLLHTYPSLVDLDVGECDVIA
jgi:hypothetical protein